MSDSTITDQQAADVDYTNEILGVVHDLLSNSITKLSENVSVENVDPCIWSFLMQMQVFIQTSYKELLQPDDGEEWAEVVAEFFRDNPEAFETKIWTERVDH